MQVATIKLSKHDIEFLEKRKNKLYTFLYNEYNSVNPNFNSLEVDRTCFKNIDNWLMDDIKNKSLINK